MTKTSAPPTVGVIGCGPSGMFFLRALEERRRKNGNDSNVVVPVATVFEREGTHGGVWRAAPTDATTAKTTPKSTVMYRDLWTNGPKEGFEFADYSFEDHFGKEVNPQIPTYIPRATALDYLTKRVTRDHPNLLRDHVRYNTSVENVTYDGQQFTVTTLHTVTGEETTHTFDYVVWAAGSYQGRAIPANYQRLFAPSQFDGLMLHSNDVYKHTPEELYHQKHVVLIGGSYSAMDLTLQACRHRASKISIVVRHHSLSEPVVSIDEWPFDTVELYDEQVVVAVEGKTVRLATWNASDQCTEEGEDDIDVLENVDTVLICTGYTADYDMLDRSVYGDVTADEWKAIKSSTHPFSVPDDWKMKPTAMDEWMAPAAAARGYESSHVPPGILHSHSPYTSHVFADVVYAGNPRLFLFDFTYGSLFLMMLDVQAHVMIACLTGELPVPSKETILAENRRAILEQELHIHMGRYWIDENYFRATHAIEHEEFPWLPGYEEVSIEFAKYYFMRMVYLAHLCRYPVKMLEFDNDNDDLPRDAPFTPQNWKLNATGNQLFYFTWHNYDEAEENSGITFRDVGDKNRAAFWSYLTRVTPAPLPTLWIDVPDGYEPVEYANKNKSSPVE